MSSEGKGGVIGAMIIKNDEIHHWIGTVEACFGVAIHREVGLRASNRLSGQRTPAVSHRLGTACRISGRLMPTCRGTEHG